MKKKGLNGKRRSGASPHLSAKIQRLPTIAQKGPYSASDITSRGCCGRGGRTCETPRNQLAPYGATCFKTDAAEELRCAGDRMHLRTASVIFCTGTRLDVVDVNADALRVFTKSPALNFDLNKLNLSETFQAEWTATQRH
jgi:hypothetical protein